MNGGGNCYIVRIGQNGPSNGPAPRSARAKELAAAPTAQIGRLRVGGARPGGRSRGRSASRSPTRVATARSPDMFKLVVKRNGEVVEEYDRATFGRGKQNVVTMVNAASKLITLEETGQGTVERLASGETALVAPPPPAAAAIGPG